MWLLEKEIGRKITKYGGDCGGKRTIRNWHFKLKTHKHRKLLHTKSLLAFDHNGHYIWATPSLKYILKIKDKGIAGSKGNLHTFTCCQVKCPDEYRILTIRNVWILNESNVVKRRKKLHCVAWQDKTSSSPTGLVILRRIIKKCVPQSGRKKKD